LVNLLVPSEADFVIADRAAIILGPNPGSFFLNIILYSFPWFFGDKRGNTNEFPVDSGGISLVGDVGTSLVGDEGAERDEEWTGDDFDNIRDFFVGFRTLRLVERLATSLFAICDYY